MELLTLWVAVALIGAPAPPATPLEPPVRSIAPGETLERGISPGESHRYTLELDADEAVVLEASQLGADVLLEVVRGDGEPVVVDRPTGGDGPESILVEPSDGPGTVQVRIERPGGTEPGSYRLIAEGIDPDTPDGADRLAAERHLTAAGELFHRGGSDNLQAATEELARARDLLERLGRTETLAWATRFQASNLQRIGRLDAEIAAHRDAAVLWRRLGETHQEAVALNGEGLAELRRGRSAEALAAFEAALVLARREGDEASEAAFLNNTCLVLHSRSALREAAVCYGEALALLRAAGQADHEAVCLNNLGDIHRLLGELEIAREHYSRALDLVRGQEPPIGEALVLNGLAVLHGQMGEIDAALAAYDRALDIFRSEGMKAWEVRTLNNLANLYARLGEHGRAQGRFRQLLAIRRELGDVRGEAATTINLGTIDEALDDPQAAAEAYRRALELTRQAGDRALEGTALAHLGRALDALGDTPEALASLERSIAIFRQLSHRDGLAGALRTMARIRFETGEAESVIEPLEEALELTRAIRDRSGEVEVLVLLTRAERRRGRLEKAVEHADEAIRQVESLRTEVTSPELRAAFVASKRKAYELAVEVRMDLHRRHPDAGHAAAALEVSEQARARSLLDLLREAQRDPERSGVSPELVERQRRLSRRLQTMAARQVEALGDPSAKPGERETAERELEEILAELDAVEAEIRRQSPRSGLPEAPRLLDAAGIRALLGDDTLLLEYSLGDERSHLWAVTSYTVAAFELPPRGQLEALAREVYGDLSTRSVGATAGDELARREELSRQVLGPVAELLGDRRLVVVTDGALGYIPFAALPRPGTGEHLLEGHEILSLPSASVLAALRQSRSRRQGPGKVAVLADAVFAPDDPRVGDPAMAGELQADRNDPERSLVRGGDVPQTGFERLPATRREAEAIARLVPEGSLHLALGFESTRSHVLETDWNPYAILHFATHGVIHAETPALSGLVLTLVDPAGQSQSGFLSLGDIYDLDLSAELVVLSGCETALGREIRGEGLMGLTQGFFHAGAEGLAVSLWRVRDRATSELMERFYRALLDDGLPPAAALAAAQRSVARERRWRDPYYWAPFVFQGDWRSGTSIEGEMERDVATEVR